MIFKKFSWPCMNVAAVSEQPCLGVSRVILQLEVLRTKLLLGTQIWNIPLQISQLLLMMTHLLLLQPSTNWFLNSWQATSIDPPEVGTYMHRWLGKNQNLDLFSKLKRLLLEPGSSWLIDEFWLLWFTMSACTSYPAFIYMRRSRVHVLVEIYHFVGTAQVVTTVLCSIAATTTDVI